MKQKFKLGEVVMTKAVAESILSKELNAKEVTDALNRHVAGDWGELDDHNKELNNEAVRTQEDRILSRYIINGEGVYIITEADRSSTTILFADEY